MSDVKMGLRLKDGDGVLMVTNRRLRVMDVDHVPVVLGKGWFVEEVALRALRAARGERSHAAHLFRKWMTATSPQV